MGVDQVSNMERVEMMMVGWMCSPKHESTAPNYEEELVSRWLGMR